MMEVAWPLSAPSLYGHSNILHNPDFRNPVNQRAVTGAISTGDISMTAGLETAAQSRPTRHT